MAKTVSDNLIVRILQKGEEKVFDLRKTFNENPNRVISTVGTPTIIDYPASYHNGACTFSFADGHSELHRWRDPRTMPRVDGSFPFNVVSPGNIDMLWLRSHATAAR